MRGSETPAARGADDGVTRRIHALLDPAQTPGFDWRVELREGGHRKKVQAYGLSFAESFEGLSLEEPDSYLHTCCIT